MNKFSTLPLLWAIMALSLLSSCSGEKVLSVQSGDYVITVSALRTDAMRVQVTPQQSVNSLPLREFVYTEKLPKVKDVKLSSTADGCSIETPGMKAVYSFGAGTLSFYDERGNLLTEEIPGTRILEKTETQGVASLRVSQGFRSPDTEHIYGTGQFQDGYLDVRGLSRRLTQVNTQISIPFILSDRGYGLLWNSYGMTEFNPADSVVTLSEKVLSWNAGGMEVNATSTSGTVRERRMFSAFEGTLDIPQSGEYSLLLDVGQSMARRHSLKIDGEVVMDMSNIWLPPTASIKLILDKGPHKIEVEGVRGDTPTLWWRAVDESTTFRSDASTKLDYTVFAGGADQVIHSLRTLTGHIPGMPAWALGYIHCRERYDTQEELLSNATEFRRRGIPVDVIVQDWQWWGKNGWNAMCFDSEKYPAPGAMLDSLHGMDFRLMLSVWSKVDRNSDLGGRLAQRGCYIEGTDWMDFFSQKSADYYWENFRDSLVLPLGIDAWWFDATEPENDDLRGRMVQDGTVPGEFYRNIYPLAVNSRMSNGLRGMGLSPLILTRSAYIGSQKYGVATWSGDVGNSFETLRRQITGGLGMMACGQGWWTYDAGGFFRPGNQYEDEEYQERMIRWIQASVFLPLMRVHGYMSRTEPWNYPARTEELFLGSIALRHELLPYIEECAARVSDEDYTIMRPLIFDFPEDGEALSQKYEFMFGPKYLVCPVTEAGITEMTVYLPDNPGGWKRVTFGRGEIPEDTYVGGSYEEVPVDMEGIPVFERLQ